MKTIQRVSGRLLAVLAGLVVLSSFGRAADAKFNMFSWQNDAKMWCFSILPYTKEPVAVAEIKGAKDQVCGRHDVKKLMGQTLPENAVVYWRTKPSEAIVLPPRDITNDLIRFSETMDYKIKLPKGDAQNSKGDRWN